MWYPPWFDSFESFVLSAVLVSAFGGLLILVRIHETLREIEKKLDEHTERGRKKDGDGTEENER